MLACVKDVAPNVFKSLRSKLEGIKGDVASKAEDAKSAASSVLLGQ